MWRQYSLMVNVYTSAYVLCLTYIYRGSIPLPQCICYKNKYITTIRSQLKEIPRLFSTDVLLIMELETTETLNTFQYVFCFVNELKTYYQLRFILASSSTIIMAIFIIIITNLSYANFGKM